VGVVFALMGMVYALMAAPTDEDRAAAAYLAARQENAAAAAIPQQTAPQQAERGAPTLGGAWTYRDRGTR
jgi:hypothetical protein